MSLLREETALPKPLPVPVEFQLPDGWAPASSESIDAFDVAFAALHPHPDAGFAATITIDEEILASDVSLPDLADEAVQRLKQFAESLQVVDRRGVGPTDTPALVQRVLLTTAVQDELRELVQTQVYVPLASIEDPHTHVVIKLALTATRGQLPEILQEFEDFVRTVRPSTPEGQ
ncbi:hypothetical protein [Streptomyces sp. NPDC016845]|uniref:hypothetical protein n=1 Tax=Streptomyces sp. NPDC016845 TaxID=3364972 RepID=UPI0037A7D2C1